MTTSALVILAMTLAPVAEAMPFGVTQDQQAPPRPPVVSPAQAKPQVDPAKTITLTGCAVAAVDREDTLQLVPAEPEPGRPVGTTGASPAWTVPAYLLLGGSISFAEHHNKTVEITGILDPAPDAAEDPKKTGDTTTRTAQTPPAPVRLQVQSAKVVAATCTPRKISG